MYLMIFACKGGPSWHSKHQSPLVEIYQRPALGFPTTRRECNEELEEDAATHWHQAVGSQPRREAGATRGDFTAPKAA